MRRSPRLDERSRRVCASPALRVLLVAGLLLGLGLGVNPTRAARIAPADASAQDGALVARVDGIVHAAMSAAHIVGASVGVMQRGQVRVAKGYGFAELEHEVKATEHTIYRIGSLTKQFTAAAVMRLVERGQLSLDDDLRTYLPDYPAKGHRITIDRLLTHTSGIKGYTEMDTFDEVMRLDLSHEQLIALFSAEPFEFEPGARYQYNNSAYYLLGVIIEKVSGTSYADFLAREFLTPMGLSETTYLDETRIIKGRAQGYEVRAGQVVNDEFLSMDAPFAAGSLGSSVLDLMRWQSALAAGTVVRAGSYARMTTPAVLNDGSKTTYGYGLQMGTMEGHRKVSHGGGINGFRTELAYYPEDDLTVVVLCNTGTAKPAVIASRIARAVLGMPESVVAPVPVPEGDLQMYVGTYHPGRSPMRVTLTAGTLHLMGTPLRPVGPHRFVAEDDVYQQVRFVLDGAAVVRMIVEREGHTTTAPRVP